MLCFFKSPKFLEIKICDSSAQIRRGMGKKEPAFVAFAIRQVWGFPLSSHQGIMYQHKLWKVIVFFDPGLKGKHSLLTIVINQTISNRRPCLALAVQKNGLASAEIPPI